MPATCLGKGWREGPVREAMEKKGNTPEYTADDGKPLMRHSHGEEGLKVQRRERTGAEEHPFREDGGGDATKTGRRCFPLCKT